jgi:hypothetical protein
MPKVSEQERIQALELKLKQLKVQKQRKEARARVGTETCGPGRREAIHGGCGKNFLFFTPRPASSRPLWCAVGMALSSTTPWTPLLRSNSCRR